MESDHVRRLIDLTGISQRIPRSMRFPVPNCQKDITMIHDFLIAFLKSPENHFSRIFLPVRQKLNIPNPGGFRSLKSNRIDPLCSACYYVRDFSAYQTILPAE